MNSDQIQSFLRTILKSVGTLLISKGYVSSTGWEEVLGSIVTIAGIAWSHFHHADPPAVTPPPANKSGTIVNNLFMIPLALLILGAPLVTTGCKTTPAVAAYKAEGVVITTVDAAMQAWAEYIKSGHGTQAQLDTVKADYETYYNAQLIVKVTIQKYILLTNQSQDTTQAAADLATANASLSTAETALITIINTFLNTKQ